MGKVKLNYENFRSVNNVIVIDENRNETFVANKIAEKTIATENQQDSIDFVEFDNGCTIMHDHKGCFYVSGLSIEEEIETLMEDDYYSIFHNIPVE